MASINEADRQIVTELEDMGQRLDKARAAIGRVIFGQADVIELALTAILGGGHALLVGAPGLAKTKLAITLGRVLGLAEKSDFIRRIEELKPKYAPKKEL